MVPQYLSACTTEMRYEAQLAQKGQIMPTVFGRLSWPIK